jgi:hypothetical protein
MGAMLSITGIFGLAAYSVSKWLKELGIRTALGAQRKQVLHADLGRAFKLLACGSATGLVLGILASRVLAHIVYQATPRDPVVLAGVFLATALLGLWATWIPAQRALSLDEDYSCNKTGWVLKALHVQLFSADQQVVVGISPRGRRVNGRTRAPSLGKGRHCSGGGRHSIPWLLVTVIQQVGDGTLAPCGQCAATAYQGREAPAHLYTSNLRRVKCGAGVKPWLLQ